MLAFAITLLLIGESFLARKVPDQSLWLIGAYFTQAAILRYVLRRKQPQHHLSPQWLLTVGVDIAVCGLMQYWHAGSSMSFLALFGFPVLMAAAMGSLAVMAVTLAAVLIVMLLAVGLPANFDMANLRTYYQVLLVWLGLGLLAMLVHHMATRLSREEFEARSSRRYALLQSQISELIIRKMNDGVVVLDEQLNVNAINPSALEMLGLPEPQTLPFSLKIDAAWRPLSALAKFTFKRRMPQSADLTLITQSDTPVGVHARSWLTWDSTSVTHPTDVQCVIFMQDLREMQARLRTEKLASMGRMSAAVAHEIRNPLSAIVQANALLAEDIADPAAQRLTTMIKQNAERLSRIAEDILDIARVQRQITDASAEKINLNALVKAAWKEWSGQAPAKRLGCLWLDAESNPVVFEQDHLRRILVNLWDNALRYMGNRPDSMQTLTWTGPNGQAFLQVWSDGAPLEKSVERHLFEPFFSSESRSSGLGLYLCRELCERHDATITYQRIERTTQQGIVAGNAFTVHFRRPARATNETRAAINELVV